MAGRRRTKKFTRDARKDEKEKVASDISALELSKCPLWPMQTVRVDMVFKEKVNIVDDIKGND